MSIMDEDEEFIIDDIDLEGDEDNFDEGENEEDAEEESDENESEDEDEDGEEEEAPRTSRANDRIRALAKARKDLEAKNLAQQQELDRLRAQHNQPKQQQQNDPQAVQAWLASLPPEQRQIAQLQVQMQDHARQMQVAQFNMQDTNDRNAYDTKAMTNPVYRKYGALVEQKLQELRQNQGLNAPREEILKHLIGEQVLKIKGKSVTKGKAGKTVEKHTVKSTNKKSDVKTGGRAGKTPKERLEGVRF